MPRCFAAAAFAALALAALPGLARANDPGQYLGYNAFPEPLNFNELGQAAPDQNWAPTGPAYPNLNAPLYPSPRPDVPVEVGGTVITNSALYPHEMLYAHKYRALYPPFYNKTRYRYGLRLGCCQTRWGFSVPTLQRVRIATGSKLMGTCVKVNYKSCISPLSLFAPPRP